jgi:hypothetical protein
MLLREKCFREFLSPLWRPHLIPRFRIAQHIPPAEREGNSFLVDARGCV